MTGKNHEGYPDPTASEAIRKTTEFGFRPLVYICSKYRGDVAANIVKAREYCRNAVDQGCIPIAPHLLFPQFMSEEKERELACFMGMVLITKCAELWVCGDEISDGMLGEIEYALKKQKPIRFIGPAGK